MDKQSTGKKSEAKPSCHLLAILLLVCGGCVEAERFQVAHYDAAKDELHCLQLFTNIVAKTPQDQLHLQNLWRNRNFVAPEPGFPFGEFEILTSHAWLKAGNHEVFTVSFCETIGRQDPLGAEFDSDEIQVRPGEFFFNAEGNLCAYQYAVYSGKALDGMLAIRSAALRELAVKGAREEIERRQKGGRRMPWAKIQAKLMDAFSGKTQPTQQSPSKEPPDEWTLLCALDDQSLELLLAATSDKSLAIRRSGRVLSLAGRLTEEDCRQLQLTFETYKRALEQGLKDGQDPKGNMQQALDGASLVQVQAQGDCFTMSVDFQGVLEHASSTEAIRKRLAEPPKSPPEESTRANRRDLVAAIRRQGIPIDAAMTPESLLQSFDAGTVPVNPSKEPIEPGTGLFTKPGN